MEIVTDPDVLVAYETPCPFCYRWLWFENAESVLHEYPGCRTWRSTSLERYLLAVRQFCHLPPDRALGVPEPPPEAIPGPWDREI